MTISRCIKEPSKKEVIYEDTTSSEGSGGYQRKLLSMKNRFNSNNPMWGKHHSEETKRKISLSCKGKPSLRKGCHLSEDTKQKLRIINLGKHLTEETRKKMSDKHKGKQGYWKGKFHTQEYKKKMSLRNMGHSGYSDEVRKRMSMANKGSRSHLWRGGITSKMIMRISNWQWKQIRKQIYQRDNWTCRICGKHCGKDIQCHHIIPYRVSLDNRPENLITLCSICHKTEEWQYYKRLKGQREFCFI